MAERALHRCEYCRAPEQVFNFAFEVDHIVPRASIGSNSPDNLALACESCNLYKGSALVAQDVETADFLPLFNPRRDHWQAHFEFNSQTSIILGVTPTGRATIERLKMNSAFQVRARGHWVFLEIYP